MSLFIGMSIFIGAIPIYTNTNTYSMLHTCTTVGCGYIKGLGPSGWRTHGELFRPDINIIILHINLSL
jgi:hypothetical protein